jgi:hypothetical protein
MGKNVRESTVKVEFYEKCARPSDFEMLRFAMKIEILPGDLLGFQQDLNDECMYYMLRDGSDEKVQEIVSKNSETEFMLGNGLSRKVKVSHANKVTKYVRVFNLPFEVDDKCLRDVFNKYGEVEKIEWEKAANILGYDVFNGVRGVYIDMKLDMPSFLYVGEFKCKLFYQGLRDKCFSCGSVGHKKSDCPKRFEPFLTPRSRILDKNVWPPLGVDNNVKLTSEVEKNNRNQNEDENVHLFAENDFSNVIFAPTNNVLKSVVSGAGVTPQPLTVNQFEMLDSENSEMSDIEMREPAIGAGVSMQTSMGAPTTRPRGRPRNRSSSAASGKSDKQLKKKKPENPIENIAQVSQNITENKQ